MGFEKEFQSVKYTKEKQGTTKKYVIWVKMWSRPQAGTSSTNRLIYTSYREEINGLWKKEGLQCDSGV